MAIKVAIGGGHGLGTPGKQTPDGYKEYLFNDAVVERLAPELINNGFQVINVSPELADTPLKIRIERANQGDIYISIHYNAISNYWNDNVGGIETYYHRLGKLLAEKVHARLIGGTKLRDRGVKCDTILYDSGLYVLAKSTPPAILVECGFMSNHNEAALMKSVAYQNECASEICQGVCDYYGRTYTPLDSAVDTTNALKAKMALLKTKLEELEELISDMEDIIS